MVKKRQLLLTCALSGLLASNLWVPPRTSADPDNLLVNPGFESGDFDRWSVSGTSPNYGVGTNGQPISGNFSGNGSFDVETHTGTYAGYAVVCHISFPPQLCSSGDSADYLDLSQTLAVIPGQTYTASFWVGAQATNGGGFGDSTQIYADGTPLLTVSLANTVPSSGFVLKSATFVPSGSSVTIQFHIQGSGIGDAGFSFDDFAVSPPKKRRAQVTSQ